MATLWPVWGPLVMGFAALYAILRLVLALGSGTEMTGV